MEYNTILRSSYAVGPIANSMYVNFGAAGDNFSFLIKKGSFTNIFNLKDAGIDPQFFIKKLFDALPDPDKLDLMQKILDTGMKEALGMLD